MSDDIDVLIRLVRAAFDHVELGGGVGLQQAQGLDDHADEATCATFRDSDEKQDWKRLSVDELNRCNSSLSFFDAEGMRFHLPAYLIAELQTTYKFALVFGLVDINDYRVAQLALLSDPQRAAVRACLLHWAADPNYEFERPRITSALDTYWSAPHERAG